MSAVTPTESGLSLNQLVAMLSARKGLIALITCLTVGIAAALAILLPKIYTANAELYVEYRGSDPISGRQFSAMQDESYMATQIDILKSDDVARYVLESTGAMRYPEVQDDIQKRGEAVVRSNLTKAVMLDLEVVPKRNSRVLELKFSSKTPEFARDALNAAIKGYMEINNRIHSAPAKSRQEQFSGQLTVLQQEIDRIQREMTAYQQENSILDADERLDTSSRQYNELATRMLTVQASQSEAATRKRSIQSLLASGVKAYDIPEIARLENVRDVRLKLLDVEGRLSEASGVLGVNHPKYKALLADKASLQEMLAKESANALRSVDLDERRLSDQSSRVTAEMKARQQQLLEMKKHRDVIASFQRQLASAQQVYTAAVARYDEILIQSNVTTQTTAVLQWAELPLRHAKPRLLNNVLLGIPGGVVLGLLCALLIELFVRRVRCVDDLRNSLPVPVLGVSA